MHKRRDIFPILNALCVFETAARELNFTTAAQKLGMAQPSVSRFISKLEDHLGRKLFHRNHKHLALTEAGAILSAATELGLGHIQSVIDEFAQKTDEKRLTIACTHGFAHMWVIPRIRSLRKLLPGWEVLLNTSEQPQTDQSETADIVIRFGAGDWPDRHVTQLFGEEVFPVCAPRLRDRLALADGSVGPADLARLPLIVQDHGEHGWLNWSAWFGAFGLEPPTLPDPHPVPSYHFVLQAATEGEGIALAWQHLAEPYLSNGWLVELPNMRVKTGQGYYATYAPEHAKADRVEEWLRECRNNAPSR